MKISGEWIRKISFIFGCPNRGRYEKWYNIKGVLLTDRPTSLYG